jgi:hypothetical protein
MKGLFVMKSAFTQEGNVALFLSNDEIAYFSPDLLEHLSSDHSHWWDGPEIGITMIPKSYNPYRNEWLENDDYDDQDYQDEDYGEFYFSIFASINDVKDHHGWCDGGIADFLVSNRVIWNRDQFDALNKDQKFYLKGKTSRDELSYYEVQNPYAELEQEILNLEHELMLKREELAKTKEEENKLTVMGYALQWIKIAK